MKMKRMSAIVLTASLLWAGTLSGCSGNPQGSSGESRQGVEGGGDTIKVGVVSAISGSYSLEGKFVKNALTILEEETNTAGGIERNGKKYKVRFIYEDNEGKPDISVNAFRKLIDQDKILALVGPPMSSCLLAAGPIAQQSKIPAIGTMTTNVACTQIGNYIFRACFIDAFQAQVAVKYILNDLHMKKVAVISNNADAYSQALATEFEKVFKKEGGDLVKFQTYAGSDVKDFNVQLTKIKESNPDVIFAPCAYMDIPLIIQQARNMGITARFLGTDSWDTPEMLKLAGNKNIEGAEYIAAFSTENPDPLSMAFTKKYRDKYNEAPNSNATFAYDAALIALEGIKKAKTLSGPDIRDAMASIKDFKGATGSTTFDKDRNPVKDALIIRIKDGTAHYVATIKP